MPRLSEAEIAEHLAQRPDWSLEDNEIVRTFRLANFPAAIAFVTHVAFLAEAAGHHPDIDIRYNRVRIALTTHDAGGLTEKDFALAAAIDEMLG
ncbi:MULTISPECIES: 4a-hydroxytetrahydrobiopterin dehydratase [Chloroflexus]|uniref:Putative pterin-4-alpha-carbinolamine dehydratase n=1 Tax=Chloroflexus islandicus TaxID=1707952 RepID=A0A178M3G5_9CHLR|nr:MULTISPECIES: 4a-hydroxytetrahydrobiopterin dehydratase [Chloroflexus]OAN42801.1 pterin dehydratase [Chloroflexus islandicus]